jgi:hypothetical protein
MFMRLFISYAHADLAQVKGLVDIFRAGGHDPWFDHKLLPGQDWQAELLAAITACDAFVYALTPDSVNSEWCQWEFARAVEIGKPVVPVLLRKTSDIPKEISRFQYADFSEAFTPFNAAQLMAGLGEKEKFKVPATHIPIFIQYPNGNPVQTLDIPQDMESINELILVRKSKLLPIFELAFYGLYLFESFSLDSHSPEFDQILRNVDNCASLVLQRSDYERFAQLYKDFNEAYLSANYAEEEHPIDVRETSYFIHQLLSHLEVKLSGRTFAAFTAGRVLGWWFHAWTKLDSLRQEELVEAIKLLTPDGIVPKSVLRKIRNFRENDMRSNEPMELYGEVKRMINVYDLKNSV